MSKPKADARGNSRSERWTVENARSVLEEWERTDRSLAEFARSRGIAPRRLYWWRRQLRTTGLTAKHAPVFEEVVLARDSSERAHAEIEIVVPGGSIVRVGREFDADTLRHVLDVLSGRARAC